MSTPASTRQFPGKARVIGGVCIAAVALAAFASAMFVRRNSVAVPAKSVSGRHDVEVGSQADADIGEARQTLISTLIRALEQAAIQGERRKVAALIDDLGRQGDHIIPPALESLSGNPPWNVRIALIETIAMRRSVPAVKALEQFYGSLTVTEKALKIETVRRMSTMGGTLARDSLCRLLALEGDNLVREETAKAVVAIGLTAEDLSGLSDKDRQALAGGVRSKDHQRSQVAMLQKIDPRTPEGLSELRKVASEQVAVAIAVLALEKLVERGDGQAAEIVAGLVRSSAETNEAKIIQTNALAALAKMRSIEARLAMKEFALKADEPLSLQTIELLGSHGDRAMVPLLEQVLLKNRSDAVAGAVERAKRSIESRARAEEGARN